jgi:serine/threonine protein kinase
MAEGDGRNRAAQAGNVAAHAAEQKQKKGVKKVDPEDLARIIAEENESKGRLPRYPGLERWQLIEKMGDGAFSNVYKARDLQGQIGEVAIKVVRKFEMNYSQVSIDTTASSFLDVLNPFLRELGQHTWWCREMLTFIRTSRSNPRLWRCAILSFLG